MAEVIAGMASSHAYAFVKPEDWDQRRERSRLRYVKQFGQDPPWPPQLEQETVEGNVARFKPLADGFARLKSSFEALHPDALIIIGDDQDENYRTTVPQFSLFTGERIQSWDPQTQRTADVPCDTKLAEALLEYAIDAGFDVAFSTSFPEDRLISHAHTQIINWLDPHVPVVLVFVNSFTPPAPAPARCYDFGRALREAIDNYAEPKRIIAYGSGGLSHFTGSYPYEAYGGPLRMGAICEDFDRRWLEPIRAGRGSELKALTSRDLLDNGAIEYRQWITLLGLLGERKPEWLEYDAFYRGIMGMSVAYWQCS